MYKHIKTLSFNENISSIKTNYKSQIEDNEILSFLTKKNEPDVLTNKIRPQCVHLAKLYTDELYLSPVTMYKYPFSKNIKYEKSEIFNIAHRGFIIALIFLYKSKNRDYIIFYKLETLIFKENSLKITKGFSKILNNNDINYKEDVDYLYVADVNISLTIDFLLNKEITELYKILLIISKNKFINGMYYEIKLLKDTKIVYENGKNMFLYTLEGPLYSECFLEYLKYKHVKILDE